MSTGFRSTPNASVAAYFPGRMTVTDASMGEAVALACEAIDAGAELVAVRDGLGVLTLAMDSQGRIWSRAEDQAGAATVAGWRNVS